MGAVEVGTLKKDFLAAGAVDAVFALFLPEVDGGAAATVFFSFFLLSSGSTTASGDDDNAASTSTNQATVDFSEGATDEDAVVEFEFADRAFVVKNLLMSA